jgi:alpha-tubulin suppressor-like RCC1 family protein
MRSSTRTLWPLALVLAACEYGPGPRAPADVGADPGMTPGALAITTTALGDGRVGQPYSGAVAVTGGTPPYTFSLPAPASDLAWLTVDPATGALSGTPTAALPAGEELQVQVTDSQSQTATAALTLAVTVCEPDSRSQVFHAVLGQCVYDLQVCSSDGGSLSQEIGTPSSFVAQCGANPDGSGACGTCSTDAADSCANGFCACGQGQPCSGDGMRCCSGACVQADGPAGCGAYVCPAGTMRCSEGCCARVAAVSAGGSSTCALLSAADELGVPAGTVKCWGYGGEGQLGVGAVMSSSLPIPAVKLSDVSVLSAGLTYFCAVTRAGAAECWGSGPRGELGLGGTTLTGGPAAMPLSEVAGIAAGLQHACAFTRGGAAYCWGYNYYDQLGTGVGEQDLLLSYTPVATGWLPAPSEIASGSEFSCALGADGYVYCWGSGPLWSDGYEFAAPHATAVSGVTGITAGNAHVCTITGAGTVKCWGNGWLGQLGDGTGQAASDTHAVEVVDGSGAALSGVTQVAAGESHTCALTSGGGVWCWGRNDAAQLGYQSTHVCQTSTAPLFTGPGKGSSRARSVSARAAADADGYPCSLSAGPVSGLSSGAIHISAGATHACAALSDGGVKCWGSNLNGELGNGETDSALHYTPVDVMF